MTLTTMYAGKINSPASTLTVAYTLGDNIVNVSELGNHPAAPNVATMGQGTDAFVVLYTGKSAATGAGTLTGVSVLQGTDKSFPVNTLVYRGFSAYDYDTLRTNVTALDSPNASIFLMPGGAFIPSTDPAGWTQGETTVNTINYQYGEFSQTVLNRMQWTVPVPYGFVDDTNLTATFYWTADTIEAGTVRWQLFAYKPADGISIDTDTASVVYSGVDTYQGANLMHVVNGAATFAITGNGNLIFFELTRDYSTDTLDDVARILAIEIKYVRTQTY